MIKPCMFSGVIFPSYRFIKALIIHSGNGLQQSMCGKFLISSELVPIFFQYHPLSFDSPHYIAFTYNVVCVVKVRLIIIIAITVWKIIFLKSNWDTLLDLLRKSPYSVRIWENKNTNQRNLHIWKLFAQGKLVKSY